LGKLLRSLGQKKSKPVAEMSSNLANDHQGQQREISCLHQQAGYKTAVNPPRHNQRFHLPHGRRPYKERWAWGGRVPKDTRFVN